MHLPLLPTDRSMPLCCWLQLRRPMAALGVAAVLSAPLMAADDARPAAGPAAAAAARTARTAPVASTAAPAPVPDTWAQRALPCTTCHQPAGQERPEGYIPSITGKPAGYLFQQLRNFRDGRRHQEAMVRQLENLDDAYLHHLAAHFEGQKPAPYRPSAPAPAAAAETARRWLQQGDASLGVPACVDCHGAALTGRPPHVPGLLGLPSGYLTAQLGAWRAGVRQARAPDCMAEIARRLPQQAIGDIARWLAAQPVPAASVVATAPATDWPLPCGAAQP